MSSYASYCQDQATDCARRARLASTPEIVAHCRGLECRWLRLAQRAQATGGALGHDRELACVGSAVRRARRGLPGGLWQTRRRVDRARRARVARDLAAKEVSAAA